MGLAAIRHIGLVCVALVFGGPVAGQGLDAYGIHVTEGEVPGYVDDAVCADCHGEVSESLKTLGMGRSFYRPSSGAVIEDFEAPPFYHAPSDRYYAMERRGEAYWFRRWREADGEALDVFETPVDWIVGSGNHARVYLYRTEGGSLFQLPLAWYSQQGKWAMAPGFEFADHLGVVRLVRHRCMTCHNAYPEVPEGAGDYGMPEAFPADLPEGIGCQRCHGPGAAHVGLALDREVLGAVGVDEVRAAIVNPADLSSERRRDVCYSCHIQPSVPLPATLRGGRGAYDFRPGEALDAHIVQIDIEDALRAPDERFEINHHPYRLEQSACFEGSGAALECTSCHDPHGKAPEPERIARYRGVCLSCHEVDAVGVPVTAGVEHPEIAAEADCTACHMPARRPQDVTEVWMTDHRIQRGNGRPDLPPPPLDKVPAEVVGVSLMDPPPDLSDAEAVIAQTLSILSYTGKTADYAAAALGRVLSTAPPEDVAPWLAFAEAALKLGDADTAYRAAEHAAGLAPEHPVPVKLMGLAALKAGDTAEALALTLRSLEMAPDMAEQYVNLALIHAQRNDVEAALAAARDALTRNGSLWQAWRLIGEIEAQRGNGAAAAEALESALAIEPGAPRARATLVAVLDGLGRAEAAARHRTLLARDTLQAR